MDSSLTFDVIIIGGGPAACAAGVYAARKQLKTLLITESFGGQSIVSDDIQNWIGDVHISGLDLAKKLEAHVRSYPDVLEVKSPEKVVGVKSDFEVTTDKSTYKSKTIIVASGARRRKLGIPGEDKFEGKGVAYCSTCLPPDESIIGNSSIQSIRNIEIDQRVLTHDGTYRKVLQTTKRPYEGKLIKIKTRFFCEPVLLTPNHPVLKCNLVKGNGINYWDFKWSTPEWVPASLLKKGDIVFYPIIKDTDHKKFIRISDYFDVRIYHNRLAYYKKGSPTAHKLPNKILLNNKFLRLVGYYLSEGCISGKGINFYFRKTEKKYIEDVIKICKKIFLLTPTTKDEGNVTRIEIYSKLVEKLFERLFGKYSYNKKLPHFMMTLPIERQREIVKGFFRGDGCVRDKDFCLVTNSRTLTYQFRDILLRLGVLPSIQIRRVEKLKSTKINDRLISFKHDKYHIVIGGSSLERMGEVLRVRHPLLNSRKRICSHAWIKDDMALLPIRQVEFQNYSGQVQNLVVEDNNTYIAKNFIVHNCDAPLFRDKKVAVVGGGNAGLEAVQDLFPYALEIYLLDGGPVLKGDPSTLDEVKKNPKLKEIILNAKVKEIIGETLVTGLKYEVEGQEKMLEIGGIFVEIGSVPNSEIVKDLVQINDHGEIMINAKHATTSHPGVFAAGDVTDDPYKQNNISAGDGVRAALAAYNYLLNREKQSPAAEKHGT